MMIFVFTWYLIITILGLLLFPLAFKMLPGLADRGYSASRALGLILWGYIFWLFTSLGLSRNNQTGILFSLAVLVIISVWAFRSIPRGTLMEWWRAQRRVVLICEILFLLAFMGWALVRSYMPEAVGTEKPMELAFINAILKSPTFPPRDPWLAGYGISYYYFGYVIVAMLAKLSATPGGTAFNLGISMVFALSALGAYGLVYNLLIAYRKKGHPQALPRSDSMFSALLGPLFLLIVSNLEGFLHSLHNRGLFWIQDASGNWVSPFWSWLDIKDLNMPPTEPSSWVPDRFWWWWRASRVLQDYDLAGGPKEIIDEFPFFSYLLADLHPHVLAMPFGLLAITLSLNLILGGAKGTTTTFRQHINKRTLAWIAIIALLLGIILLAIGSLATSIPLVASSVLLLIFAVIIVFVLRREIVDQGLITILRTDSGTIHFGRILYLRPPAFLLAGIVLGGMFFLNAWDFPVYVALYVGAYVLWLSIDQGKPLLSYIPDFLWLGIVLGVSGVILYLPFYLSFSSQAGGLLPNLISPTRGAHLWVMFAPLLIPIFAFLAYLFARYGDRRVLMRGLRTTIGIGLVLFIMALAMGLAIVMLPGLGDFYKGFLGSQDTGELFRASLIRRLVSPGGWITLVALLTLALTALFGMESRRKENTELGIRDTGNELPDKSGLTTSHTFAVLVILLGGLMVFGPEFFYLRDQFGWRMNTIFKFYYQAWLLWSIAAAYGSIILIRNLRGGWGVAFRFGLVLLLVAGLVYPFFSLWNKTNGFQVAERSLDSSMYLLSDDPDSWAAVQWLKSAPEGIVAEAVPAAGGSYTHNARMATLSGVPNLLGWVGHQSQWRGGGEAMGNRQSDLARLYCTRDWSEALIIIDEYDIRYIVVGPLERNAYKPDPNYCPAGLVDAKFLRNLTPAFESGGITIYEYNSGLSGAP